MENKNLEILKYLQNLKNNNNKQWFDSNSAWYSEVRTYFANIVEQLIYKIGQFDFSIANLTAKDTMFRINRDIRFSKDKTPYKTNFGAYIANGGRKSIYAGYYLHFEHDEVFLAGGIYKPDSEVLSRIRWGIYQNIEYFLQIIDNTDFKNEFGTIVGEQVKKTPSEFDKNFKYKDLLKFKDYNIIRYLKIEEVIRHDFIDFCSEIYQKMLPFNTFLNQCITNV